MVVMNEDPLVEARIRKGRTSHQRATQDKDIKLMLANGYLVPTPTTTLREAIYHFDSEYNQDEGVASLALVSSNSYDIFDSPNEGIGRFFMAKGPKVSHPEYVDFDSDEDDLLGDDDLLVDNTSNENYDGIAINHDNQDETNDNDKKEIQRLTKELNTLKLAHETTLEDHR